MASAVLIDTRPAWELAAANLPGRGISRPGPRRLPEGRPGSRGPCRPRFWRRRENPCSAQKFPAHSLLGAKKIPARPRRESFRKTLESKAVSAHIFAKEGRVPYKFAARREFSLAPGPYPASESRAASANSTDTIWKAGRPTRAAVPSTPCRKRAARDCVPRGLLDLPRRSLSEETTTRYSAAIAAGWP